MTHQIEAEFTFGSVQPGTIEAFAKVADRRVRMHTLILELSPTHSVRIRKTVEIDDMGYEIHGTTSCKWAYKKTNPDEYKNDEYEKEVDVRIFDELVRDPDLYEEDLVATRYFLPDQGDNITRSLDLYHGLYEDPETYTLTRELRDGCIPYSKMEFEGPENIIDEMDPDEALEDISWRLWGGNNSFESGEVRDVSVNSIFDVFKRLEGSKYFGYREDHLPDEGDLPLQK